jgi:hypothetical protein
MAITAPRYFRYLFWRTMMRVCAWLDMKLIVAGNINPAIDRQLTAWHDACHMRAARADRRM